MLKNIYSFVKPFLYSNASGALEWELVPNQEPQLTDLKGVLERPLSPGWYMLEWLADGDFDSSTVKLGSNIPDSHNLEWACYFSFQRNRLSKRIVHVPGFSRKIHFSIEKSSPITIKTLRFVPLRKGFARKLMLKRIGRYMNLPKGKLIAGLKAQSLRTQSGFEQTIFDIYDKSFIYSIDEAYAQWIINCEPRLFESYVSECRSGSSGGDKNVMPENYKLIVSSSYKLRDRAEDLMAEVLNNNPDVVLVYADEDEIDKVGRRSNPNFKSDWNPEFFLSHDYISSCYLCRQSWFESHIEEFKRFGDHAALSRLLPLLPEGAVLHLPLVLSHRWRERTTDFVVQTLRKAALVEALGEKYKPAGCKVDTGLLPGFSRIHYALPKPLPLVSLLIPTRDALHVLRPCVESILQATDYPHYEILILDNQSSDPMTHDWFDVIQQDRRVRILRYDLPFNYSAINNFGAGHARGDVIGLVNNDVEVISAGWLTEMVSHVCREPVGCVGAKLYYSNGQIQHGGVILGLGDVAGHAHRFLDQDDAGYHGRLKAVQNLSAVTAACLLVRRGVYEQVGGLDEEHLTVAYNDVDFCLRVRAAGYQNLWTPYAELYHHESISRGEDDTPEKKARFDKEVAYMRRVWGEELENDPFYNPNLSRRREDFSLREFLI